MKRLISKFVYLIFRIKERLLSASRSLIFYNIGIYPPPKVLGKVYLNAKKIHMGKNVTLYPGVYLWGNEIFIGDNVDIGIGTIIHSTNGIHIGDNTVIAGQCYIIDSNHGTKNGELIRSQKSIAAENGITIGNDVWIGAQSSILKGSKINDHAVIGANTVVNSEIPENAIAVGSPAKIIKYRK